jgi:hypothetical protein
MHATPLSVEKTIPMVDGSDDARILADLGKALAGFREALAATTAVGEGGSLRVVAGNTEIVLEAAAERLRTAASLAVQASHLDRGNAAMSRHFTEMKDRGQSTLEYDGRLPIPADVAGLLGTLECVFAIPQLRPWRPQVWRRDDEIPPSVGGNIDRAIRLFELLCVDRPDDDLDWKPASYFLKRAAKWLFEAKQPHRKSKRVRSRRDRDGTQLYYVPDVHKYKPALVPSDWIVNRRVGK